MTKTDTFLEEFFKHEYDPVKAREYYLRNRKLKGRKRVEEDEVPMNSPSGAKLVNYDGAGAGQARYSDGSIFDGRGWTFPTRRPAGDNQRGKEVAPKKTRVGNNEERLAATQSKLNSAREKAKKLPKSRREQLESKIDALEKKLKKLKPKTTTKVRTYPVNGIRDSKKTVVKTTRRRFLPDTRTVERS